MYQFDSAGQGEEMTQFQGDAIVVLLITICMMLGKISVQINRNRIDKEKK